MPSTYQLKKIDNMTKTQLIQFLWGWKIPIEDVRLHFMQKLNAPIPMSQRKASILKRQLEMELSPLIFEDQTIQYTIDTILSIAQKLNLPLSKAIMIHFLTQEKLIQQNINRETIRSKTYMKTFAEAYHEVLADPTPHHHLIDKYRHNYTLFDLDSMEQAQQKIASLTV